ncbi:MAG: type II toxin-antitoxin system RelE/ParE family toxin [Planctomycetes bacterium]|nr:type II toxin-antitoxin system RelE/ParE family toxin [Planctomycetota bacterium]
MASYTVVLRPSAREAIGRLPNRKIQRQIVARIERLGLDPRPRGYKVLHGGKGLCRIRSGDYRIIYRIEDRQLIVAVVRVGGRKDVYQGL